MLKSGLFVVNMRCFSHASNLLAVNLKSKIKTTHFYDEVNEHNQYEILDNLYAYEPSKSHTQLIEENQQVFEKNMFNVMKTLEYDNKLQVKMQECLINNDFKKLFYKLNKMSPLKDLCVKSNSIRCDIGKGVNGDPRTIGEEVKFLYRQPKEKSNYGYLIIPIDRLDFVASEFKLILSHLKSYLNESKYESRVGYKFYSSNWLWNDVECRKSSDNKLMMILSCNPGERTKEELEEIASSLKKYFVNGPGKESNLSSIYIKFLNRNDAVKQLITKGSYYLVNGDAYLQETVSLQKLNFWPINDFPVNYEHFKQSTEEIQRLVNENANNFDCLLDLNTNIGELSSLTKHMFKKYVLVPRNHKAFNELAFNLDEKCLKDYVLLKSFGKIFAEKLISELGENCEVSVVISEPKFDEIHVLDKVETITETFSKLRAFPNIKSIVYHSQQPNSHSLLMALYTLSCGARERKEKFVRVAGEPFVPMEAKLLCKSTDGHRYTAIFHYERD